MVSGMAAQKKKNTGREISGRLLSIESVLSIYSLDAGKLYLPSQVAGKVANEPSRRKKLAHRMRNWIKYHCHDPEGKVGSHNAWYGRTWQSFIDDADLERAASAVTFSELLRLRIKTLEEKELEAIIPCERVETCVQVPLYTPAPTFSFQRLAFILAACLMLFISGEPPEKEPSIENGGFSLIFEAEDVAEMPDIATFTDLLTMDVKEMRPRRIVSPESWGNDDFLSMVFIQAPRGTLFPVRLPDTLTPVPIL